MFDKYIKNYYFFAHYYYNLILQIIIIYILYSKQIQKYLTFSTIPLSVLKIYGQYTLIYTSRNFSAINTCIMEQTKYFFLTIGCIIFLKQKFKIYQYIAILIIMLSPIVVSITGFKGISVFNIFIGFSSVFCRSCFVLGIYYFKKVNKKYNIARLVLHINYIAFLTSFLIFIVLLITKKDNVVNSYKSVYHFLFTLLFTMKDIYSTCIIFKASAMNSSFFGSLAQIGIGILVSIVIDKDVKLTDIFIIIMTILGILLFNFKKIKEKFIKKK
ncbi:hypothetical protein SLOPH_894 [Spraguea lophii 42_110]|uniref:Transporter n=1 Tax=Spraguea lophii (strain 42_110) TaxID=1358809 RepID=S7WBA2_SPRLO|nr:hypothetical protein SLOPH_894 [Spraguea lophii 42_110]